MAAPIEQLLKSAKALNAEQLVLEAGKSAYVVTSAGMKELTKTLLTPYDIFKLISPIMPEDKKVALVGQPSTEFIFALDGVGQYKVTVFKESNGIKVHFYNDESETPAAAASGPLPQLVSTQPFTGKAPLPPTQPIANVALPPTGPVPSIPSPAPPPTASPLVAKPASPPMAQPAPPPMASPAPPPPTAALPPTANFAPPMAQPAPPPMAQPAAPPMAQPATPLMASPAPPPMAQPAQPPTAALPLKASPAPPPMAQPATPPMAQPVPIMAQPAMPPMAQPAPQPLPATTNLAPTEALPASSQQDQTVPLDAQQRAALLNAKPVPIEERVMALPMSPPPARAVPVPAPPAMPSTTSSNTMSRTQSSFAQTTERERLKTEVDRLLERTIKMRGSDLHLATGAPPIVRRFGSLIRIEGDPLDIDKARMLVRELLTDDQFSRFEKTNDLDFSYEIVGVGRFRGNVLRQYRGIDLTFHIVPTEILTPEELGLPPVVREVTRNHQGLILVTGAAGQGKSTTISSLVDVINSERPLHIITVEDPIEFVHPINKMGVVNQREVGRHTHSFANALRAALREDPDVIVVGEMRDLETISLAITAAETGHLVMGTMMTSSAHQTVDRVLESFPPNQQNQIRTMLSESLRAVISQRLLPRADETGMVLAAEILIGTPAVANLIRDKKTFQIPSIIQTNRQMGMKRMDDALAELVLANKITPQRGLEYAFDKRAFEIAVSRP